MEPEFVEQVINESYIPPTNSKDSARGPIYLAKENNVISEQTFAVVVDFANKVPLRENFNLATRNMDYAVRPGFFSFVVLFPPNHQNIVFPIVLFPDTFPEGTEALLARSAPGNHSDVGRVEHPLPGYSTPVSLPTETLIIIEDDDRKLYYNSWLYTSIYLIFNYSFHHWL